MLINDWEYYRYRSKEKKPKYLREDLDSNKSCLLSPPTPMKDRFLDVDQSSGSGSGMPLLVNDHIKKNCHQIFKLNATLLGS